MNDGPVVAPVTVSVPGMMSVDERERAGVVVPVATLIWLAVPVTDVTVPLPPPPMAVHEPLGQDDTDPFDMFKPRIRGPQPPEGAPENGIITAFPVWAWADATATSMNARMKNRRSMIVISCW